MRNIHLLHFKETLNRHNSASRRAKEGSKKKGNHQNLTPEIMNKSNPVQLYRFGCTSALITAPNSTGENEKAKTDEKEHFLEGGG